MNAPNEPLILELTEVAPKQPQSTALARTDNSPVSLMLTAMERGVSPEHIEKMMALQERWEANEARKAFAQDLAAFKGEAVEIIKRKQVDFANKSGGRTKYKHAELFDVIEAVGPALSRHGFSWSFDTKQSERWLDVTCILRHRLGHQETVTLGGPPDESGGKNSIQAWMSTKTYLERHTLKAICGVAEKGEDDDGNGGAGDSAVADMLIAINEAPDQDALKKLFAECINATRGNTAAQKKIIAAKDARKKELA